MTGVVRSMSPDPGEGRLMKIFAEKLFRPCVLLLVAIAAGAANAYQPYGYQAPPGMYPQQYPDNRNQVQQPSDPVC